MIHPTCREVRSVSWRLSFLLVALYFITTSAFAGGYLVTDSITSSALEGNVFGDSPTRNLIVYLPPSYDAGGNFPVLYLLHGAAGYAERFTEAPNYYEDFPEEGFVAMIDAMIAEGAIQEMIIAMPDATFAYGGSFFANGSLGGNHEDYVVRDVVGYMDTHYRTLAFTESRAIAGHSMGGYGAMKLAMKHPDVFGVVASHGGPLFFEALKPLVEGFIAENPDGIIGPHPEREMTSLTYMAAAAFAPNPENLPFLVDLHFTYPEGAIIDDVWARWLEHDCFTLLGEYGAGMTTLQGIYFDAANQDELGMQAHAQVFDEALTGMGIAHEYQTYDGMHDAPLYSRFAVSFPFMSDRLVGQGPEANKIVVRRAMEELVGQGKLELADQLYHESWVSDSVPGVQGPEAARLLAIGSRSGTPDLQITVEDQIAEGDLVVSRWNATGTHLGEWAGIPATGVVWTMSAIDIQRLEDGKIAQSWDYEDTLGLLVQLGVVPMPRATFTWGEPSDITGDPGTPEANKALVRRAFGDIWDPVNYDFAGEVYAEDYLSHVVGSPDVVGLDMVKAVIVTYLGAFPDFQYHIEDQIAEGDKVVTTWTVTGTHMGELNGIPATGKPVVVKGVDIHRIADGRLQEGWSVMDEYGFMQQIGILPGAEPSVPEEDFSRVFFLSLESGLNMVSLPLKPVVPQTARSFAEALSATAVIQIDAKQQKFVGFTPDADDDGFAIEGGQGYIVNVSEGRVVAFTGAAWTNEPPVEMAPVMSSPDSAWAFVVNAELDDPSLSVQVVNTTTGSVLKGIIRGAERFTGVWADLNRQPVIHTGDDLEVTVSDASGILGRLHYSVRSEDIQRAFVTLPIHRSALRPEANALHPNYPNPFNPETWIPYELAEAADVSIRIFGTSGHLVRDLVIGHRSAGYYLSRSRAAYWDGRNQAGERVSSGLYTVMLQAGDFNAIRRMLVVK